MKTNWKNGKTLKGDQVRMTLYKLDSKFSNSKNNKFALSFEILNGINKNKETIAYNIDFSNNMLFYMSVSLHNTNDEMQLLKYERTNNNNNNNDNDDEVCNSLFLCQLLNSNIKTKNMNKIIKQKQKLQMEIKDLKRKLKEKENENKQMETEIDSKNEQIMKMQTENNKIANDMMTEIENKNQKIADFQNEIEKSKKVFKSYYNFVNT